MFTPQSISVRLLAFAAVATLVLSTGATFVLALSHSDAATFDEAAAPLVDDASVTVASLASAVEPIASVEIGPTTDSQTIEIVPVRSVIGTTADVNLDDWLAVAIPDQSIDPAATPEPVQVQAAVATNSAVAAKPEATSTATTAPLSVKSAPYYGPTEPITPATPAPTPAPEPVPVLDPIAQTMAGPGWAALRNCESGGNGDYLANTGNSFYGAYQFTLGTWNAVAEIVDPQWIDVRPDQAPPHVQDRMAHALRYEIAWGGWHHWPICGRHVA